MHVQWKKGITKIIFASYPKLIFKLDGKANEKETLWKVVVNFTFPVL